MSMYKRKNFFPPRARYEIVFRNAIAREVVLRDPAPHTLIQSPDRDVREIQFGSQVRSQVQLLSLPTFFGNE